jgi:O-antigen/teichoic acid export membrane protein
MIQMWDFIGAALLDQMLVSGVSFLIGIYLAKALGIAQFGQFSLILLITYFCLELQRALIIAPMMTYAAVEDNAVYLPQLGFMQMIFNLAVSLGATAFILLSSFYFPKWQIGSFAGVAGFIVFSRMQQEFLRRIFFVQDHPIRALVLDIITFSTLLLAVIMLTMTHRLSLKNILWWHTAAYLCPSFLSMTYLLKDKIDTAAWSPIYKKHLAFGRWLMGGAMVQFLSSNWLIMSGGALLGAKAVGLIKAAQYLLGGVTMLFQALENVVPLKLARLYQKGDHTAASDYLFKISLFLVCFVTFYIVMMLNLVPVVARYLKVTDLHLFVKIARLLLLQSFLYGPILILTYILRAHAMTRPIFITHSITAVLTVLAAPVIIPLWHEMAIVYGLATIQMIVIIFFSFFVYRSSRRHG